MKRLKTFYLKAKAKKEDYEDKRDITRMKKLKKLRTANDRSYARQHLKDELATARRTKKGYSKTRKVLKSVGKGVRSYQKGAKKRRKSRWGF